MALVDCRDANNMEFKAVKMSWEPCYKVYYFSHQKCGRLIYWKLSCVSSEQVLCIVSYFLRDKRDMLVVSWFNPCISYVLLPVINTKIIFGIKAHMQIKNSVIHETVEMVKHCVFVYMTERGWKNMHNSYNSYCSLLTVDMYAFYINICAMFGTVCTIFGGFVTVYNRKGNCLTLCL